jgi:hypothetical protein
MCWEPDGRASLPVPATLVVDHRSIRLVPPYEPCDSCYRCDFYFDFAWLPRAGWDPLGTVVSTIALAGTFTASIAVQLCRLSKPLDGSCSLDEHALSMGNHRLVLSCPMDTANLITRDDCSR